MNPRIPLIVRVLLYAIRLTPVLILGLGVWHLTSLLQHLNRPLYNLSVHLEGQEEPATIQVQRAELDLHQGSLQLLGAALKNSREETVLFVRNLKLTLPVPWTQTRTTEVVASGGHAKVVRLPDGSLDLLRLLPPTREEKPSETPFSVRLENLSLRYVDTTGEEPTELTAEVRDGLIVGAAGVSVGTAHVAVPGSGSLRAQFETDTDGLAYLEAETDGFEFGDLLPKLQRIREWPKDAVEPVSARRATFRGTVAAWRSDGWRWTSAGALRAEGFAYGEYRVASAEVDATADWRQVAGRVTASDRATQARGVFALRWSPFQFRFDGSARSDDPSILQRANVQLPKDLRWSGLNWNGSLLYEDSLRAYGDATLRTLSWQELTAHDTTAKLVLADNRLRVYQLQSKIANGRLAGDLSLNLNDLSLQGYASLSGADPLAIPYLPDALREHLTQGQFDAQALFTGTLQDPRVRASVHGINEVVFPGEVYTVVDQPEISAVLTYSSGNLAIESLLVGGRSGSVVASGSIDLSSLSLDLNVRASAMDLLAYPDSPVYGTGYADVKIHGPLDALRVEGPVELYGISNGSLTIPIITFESSMEANRRVSLTSISARQGASELTGSLVLAPSGDTWAITGEGTLRNVSLSAATDGEVIGLADGSWNAGGTVQDPSFEATLSSDALFVRDLPIEQVQARGRWKDQALHLEQLTAQFAGGSVSGSGTYALTGESSAQFQLENIDVSQLSGLLGEAILLEGQASVAASVNFSDGALKGAQASLEAGAIAVNGQPVGNGGFEFDLSGQTARLTGSIGSLEGYFILDELVYDVESGAYTLQAAVLNLPASAIRTFADAGLTTLSAETQEYVRNVDGLLTLNLEAEGRVSLDPETRRTEEFVTNGHTTLELTNLSFRSEPFGTIRAEAQKTGTLWKFSDLTWTDGPVSARLLGSAPNTLDEAGDVHVDLELYDIRLDALSRALALSQPLTGSADLVLSASGPTESPIVLASLDASGITVDDAPPFDVSLVGVRVEDGAIALDPNEGVGYLNVKSFQARLDEARIPFRYPFEFPDEPLRARITVPERDLNAVSDFFGGLDTAVTSGTIHEGTILVSGTLSEPKVEGQIEAEAERLAFAGLDQIFHNAKARVNLDGMEASWTGEVHDDSGGSLRSTGIVDLNAGEFKDALLDIDQFHLRQEVGDRNRFTGALAGSITASGPFGEPQVRGSVTVLGGSVELAGEFPAGEGPVSWPINPAFDVQLGAEPFRFTSGPLKATVTAEGTLLGTLESPQLRTEFQIQDGSLTLPTTDLRFAPGSRAVLVYAPAEEFESDAKLDVVLNATTRVTASNGLNVQRYLINLTITGDALSDEDFNILATSDPPDLSLDQILAILGQQQLIEDVAGAALGGFNSQLTQTIGSVIAPVLARSVTRSLEQSLGLDYLAFDIRPGSPTTVTLIKTLGSGFSLEYRRTVELFEQTGVPLEEIGLTYVPRIRNPILGRVRISVVGQRDGILRLSIGYWQRF